MAQVSEYLTAEGSFALEMDEKRSRFIAVVTHVESMGDVNDFLDKLKKSNKDAKHVCYGYCLGADSMTAKNNDDGEPAGSAGAPISDALAKIKLTDTLVAVVRYYGGIQLGKSKLSRMYFNVAFEALKQCKKARMVDCAIYAMTLKYPDFVPVGTYLRDNKLPIISAEYGDVVSLRVALPSYDTDRHISEIKTRMSEEFMFSKIDSEFFKMD